MTLLRQALAQTRPEMVQIPRHIAEWTLDLIGSCVVCVDGVPRHHDVRKAMMKALEDTKETTWQR